MAKDRNILPVYLQNYINSISAREEEILKMVREKTSNHPCAKMQITPDQGELLKILIKLLNPKNILEVGVFTGYSSVAMGLAMAEDAKITCIDKNPEWTSRAKNFWKMAGLSDKIELHLGKAAEILNDFLHNNMNNTFDFIFVDADKQNYPIYYEYALKLCKTGGLIIFDNILWGGKVANPEFSDKTTDILKIFNNKLHQDERVDISVIPISDGMTLIRKK